LCVCIIAQSPSSFMDSVAGQAPQPHAAQLLVKHPTHVVCGRPTSSSASALAAEPDSDADSNDDKVLPALDVQPNLQDKFRHYTSSNHDLWEAVYPPHVQKETVQVSAMRLPGKSVTRIMQLHPLLATTSPDGLELVRCATTLLLQASARSLARQCQGKRVQFDKVQDLCKEVRELNFLCPLDGVLDTSSRRKPILAPAHMCINNGHSGTAQGRAQGAQLGGKPAPKSCPGQKSAPTCTSGSKKRSTTASTARSERPIKAAKTQTDAPGIWSFFHRAQAGG